MLRRFSLIAMGLLAAAACSPAASSTETQAGDSAAVRAAVERYIAAGRSNDTTAMFGAWTDDGVYVNTGVPTIRGRAGIDSVIRAFHTSMSVTRLDVDIDELSVSGDAAYAIGTFNETMRGAGTDSLAVRGRFLQIWRRQPDGSWKLARAFGADLPGS